MIVDIADMNRVLVDGPNFPRTMYPLKRLSLTKIRCDLNRGAKTGAVTKAWDAASVDSKFKALPIAMKMAKKDTRDKLNDFERFSVMMNRKRRAFRVRHLAAKK